MVYRYIDEKTKLFTDKGQQMILQAYANARKILKKAGAFKTFYILNGVDYEGTFQAHAVIDRLVELKYIREVTPPNTAGKDQVYVAGINMPEF